MTPDIPQKSMLFVTPIIPEVKRGDVLLIDKDSLLDSIPKKFLKIKYNRIATTTAKDEKMNCLIDSPKNIDSLKSRISLFILISIYFTPPFISFNFVNNGIPIFPPKKHLYLSFKISYINDVVVVFPSTLTIV